MMETLYRTPENNMVPTLTGILKPLPDSSPPGNQPVLFSRGLGSTLLTSWTGIADNLVWRISSKVFHFGSCTPSHPQMDETPRRSGTSTFLSPDFEAKVAKFLSTVTARMRENAPSTENDGGEQKYAPTTPSPPDMRQQQGREWVLKGIPVPSFGVGAVRTDRDGTAVFSRSGGEEQGSTARNNDESKEIIISGDDNTSNTSGSDLPETVVLHHVCALGGPQRRMHLPGSMDGSSQRTTVQK